MNTSLIKTLFDSIATEFSGKEFTKEDLIDKFGEIYNADESIEDNIWIGKDKFSIIESYPELSEEEIRMLSEIMKLYTYEPSCPSNSALALAFIGGRKRHRKNISQWYKSLFLNELIKEEYDKDSMEVALNFKTGRCNKDKLWIELYSNEKYCKKIIEQDINQFYIWQCESIYHDDHKKPLISLQKETYEDRKIRFMKKLGLNEL